MGNTARARELANLGRFRDALDALPETVANLEVGVLRAELLERTGRPKDSLFLVKRLLNQKKLDERSRVRLLVTSGIIELEDGLASAAIGHLAAAREIAQNGKYLEELFWAEVRLLLATFEASPTADLTRLLANARKRAVQLGDSVASIALHLFVCEMEAKKGALDTSRRHLRVARSLLQEYPNEWLEGLAQICDFCIAYLEGDLDAADRAAIGALRSAHASGHARTELAAVIDIGHVRLRQGKSDETNRLFRHALALCSISTRCREYVLDGLAQLALSRGELEKSEHLMEELYSSRFVEQSYPKLWSFPTRARIVLARQRFADARALSSQGWELAQKVGDQSLMMRLRLLSAEAAAHDGDVTAASEAFLVAALGHPSPSLELVAERNRVAGLVLDASGDAEAAHLRLERSRRMLEGIGHSRAAADIARALDARPSRPPGAARERPDITAARAAALFEQASRADLLALELTDLLFDTGAVRALAVVTVDGDGAPRIVSTRGWNDAEALAAFEHPTALPRLALGSWRNLQWSLLADVPPTATARAAFVAVRTLADGALTVNEARRAERERSALWPIDPVDDATHGVFASESMLDLVKTIRRVAATPVTMLLTGETGTGKDVLAQLIHEYSPRASRPFVPFNCTAVPREMLDSQLFGHRRGAFTGAQEQSPGVIRGAQGGTLFLDEIGELGPEPQVKLLRFLESSEVHPIGEPHPVHVDVRVVAATNRDLEALVKDGLFREDLYYRLNVVRLRVPPLRERREEIPLIVDHYLTRFGPQFKKGQLTASSETMEYLLLHSWPGNVRQLANELRRAAALAEPDSVIVPEHLSPEVLASRRTIPAGRREPLPTELLVRLDQPLDAAVEHLERALLHHAMQVSHGHMDQAAQLLGLSRKGLYLKRQRLGLEPSGPAAPRLDGRPGGPTSGDESLPH